MTNRILEAAWAKRYPEWAEAPVDEFRPHADMPARRLPRYLWDHLTVRARAQLKTRHPWVTQDALLLLDQLLTPTSRGLEYGSGGTTAWFAERVEFLYSVEGGAEWHQATLQHLASSGIDNVNLQLAAYDELGYGTPQHREAYVNAHPELRDSSLDFVFVDAEYRDDCMMRGVGLLKAGGLLILDNAELYLPGDTRSPWHVHRPITPLWEQVAHEIADWRRVATTNGVWDTVIWIKP